MFNTNDINAQARFFCALGYSREKVIAQLTTSFPRETPAAVEQAWKAAVAQARESERQLDAAVRENDQRAKRAEHDLNVSMHDA